MKRWMILCCLGLASVSLGCAEAPPAADASEGPANVEATPADPSVGPTEEEADEC